MTRPPVEAPVEAPVAVVRVLPGRPDYAAQLAEAAVLFDAYRQFYGQPANAGAAHAFLNARLTRAESVLFLAVPTAPRGGAPPAPARAVGLVQLYPGFTSVGLGRLWVLNDLFVAPSARGGGTGAALLARARQYGAETGAVRLVLATALDNPARRLYARAGWGLDTAFAHYTLALPAAE